MNEKSSKVASSREIDTYRHNSRNTFTLASMILLLDLTASWLPEEIFRHRNNAPRG